MAHFMTPASDEIRAGDAVMVTLDDATSELAATVIEKYGSGFDCRLARNGMVVTVWATKIRKA